MAVPAVIAAVIAIAELVSEITQEIAASATEGLSPQQEACIENHFESYINDTSFQIDWGKDFWQWMWASVEKRDGQWYHGNAGSSSAKYMEDVMKGCKCSEESIERMKVIIYEKFGNQWAATNARKKLLKHEKKTPLYAKNSAGGSAEGAGSNTTLLIAGGLVLLLLLKGKK